MLAARCMTIGRGACVSQVPSVSARATLCTTAALGARLESVFAAEHMQMRESLRKFIDTEINPHVGVATFYHMPTLHVRGTTWWLIPCCHRAGGSMGGGWHLSGARAVQENGRQRLPGGHQANKVWRAGIGLQVHASAARGVQLPTDSDAVGHSYGVAVAEELGSIACGGVPMAIGVQTDMATPALAKFGSDSVRERFLAPSIAGDYVACLGVRSTSGVSSPRPQCTLTRAIVAR